MQVVIKTRHVDGISVDIIEHHFFNMVKVTVFPYKIGPRVHDLC
jgi:hypothetical protein